MAVHFSKKTALTLFCYFRQAERSVHYALSCPSQWSQFVAYYDKVKQSGIAEMIGMLKESGAVHDEVPTRQALAQNSFMSMIRTALGFLINPLKSSWSFSVREISFFSATLEHLLTVLHQTKVPDKKELIDLRLDCFECHYLVGRKLIGIPEIRKADLIEHFYQSDYVSRVTLQDMGIDNS